ncbi:hypothetical protein [Phragmitibacter flavus]|nr:hypothetical protein [Phragmitibacter flavus]
MLEPDSFVLSDSIELPADETFETNQIPSPDSVGMKTHLIDEEEPNTDDETLHPKEDLSHGDEGVDDPQPPLGTE